MPLLAVFAAILVLAVPEGDGVRIQFLGTGHPDISADKPRMQSAITVDVGGDRWLLDVGAGSVARMFDHHKAPESIDHLFVSHLHFDHTLDLDAFLWLWRTGSGHEESPGDLNIWGPDGLADMLAGYYNVAYAADGRGRGLLRMPAVSRKSNREAGVFDGGDYRVSFQEVRHARQMDCWAVKFETPNGTLVYSGDLGSGPGSTAADNNEFAEFAKGADLLIVDTLHLVPEELGKLVQAIAPKRVVFSHLAERTGPQPVFRGYDLAKTIELAGEYAEEVIVAEDGMELDL
jgi:ribonuclease BN (tRNA processing enzyme)